MQHYRAFLSDRIKILADEISKEASNDEMDLVAIADMSKEIYSYCKVIKHLNNGGNFATTQHE